MDIVPVVFFYFCKVHRYTVRLISVIAVYFIVTVTGLKWTRTIDLTLIRRAL